MPNTLGDSLAERIANTPDISNATARVAMWIHGVALISGGYPVDVSYRQIQKGIKLADQSIPGTGCRVETIKEALSWLEDHKWLVWEPGTVSSFNTVSKRITIC